MVNSYQDMMGDEQDPQDHPAHNVPQATQHYAGDVVQFPISQQASETRRAVDLGMRGTLGLGNKPPAGAAPAKILLGPGAAK